MNVASALRGERKGWRGGGVRGGGSGEAAARGILAGLLHSVNSYKLHSGLFH